MAATTNSENSLVRLLEKYVENTCTRKELHEFLDKCKKEQHREDLFEMLKAYWEKPGNNNNNLQVKWEEKFGQMMKQARARVNKTRVRQLKKLYGINTWLGLANLFFLIA